MLTQLTDAYTQIKGDMDLKGSVLCVCVCASACVERGGSEGWVVVWVGVGVGRRIGCVWVMEVGGGSGFF